MRGSFEEVMTGTLSRPMTFMAGLYNTLPKGLPELPVLPDCLPTNIDLDGEMFGIARMCDAIRRDRDLPAAEIIQNLRRDVDVFTHSAPQADDLTAIIVKKT